MSNADDLRAALEGLAVMRTRVATAADATDAELEFLMARIKLLTDALRHAEADETARLSARLLLGDLALVAAHFRGTATALSAQLDKALSDIRAAVDAASEGPDLHSSAPT